MPSSLEGWWRLAAAITTPFLVYQISVTVFVVFSLINAIADWFTFRAPHLAGDTRQQVGPPQGRDETSVSVLIPARNEEATIAPCVLSLLTEPVSEILVLDDHSTDDTARIVAALAAEDTRVRLLTGGELLPGWKGKPNALRQLAAAASSEILLLTDADCVFYPGSVAAALQHRERVKADCLSLIPYLECRSFWEHVIVPLQYVLVFITLPVRNIYATRNPAFAAANGAFLLLPRATYTKLGGHEPVRGEMAEDIKFAQHVKRSGLRLVYGDGTRIYRVRMYESLRGIWDGFSKNLFPAMGKSLPILTVWTLFLLTTQVLPFAFLGLALARADRTLAGFMLPLAHVISALAIRIALSLRFRQAVWVSLLQPVGWLVTLAIGANSAYLAYSGKGHAWKGRVYET